MKKIVLITLAFFASSCLGNDLEKLQNNCQENNGEACAILGISYEDGTSGPQDLSKAISYFEKACDLDSGIGCFRLGRYLAEYDYAKMELRDEKKAQLCFEKACKYGSGAGCERAGLTYAIMPGAENKAKAKEFYQKAKENYEKGCEEGSGQSCSGLGFYYVSPQFQLDDKEKSNEYYLKAKDIFSKECKEGSGESCSKLAALYKEGAGVSKAPYDAGKYQAQACSLKYYPACVEAAQFYEDGIASIPVDLNKATELFKVACDKTKAESACESLKFLSQFSGLTPDYYPPEVREICANYEKAENQAAHAVKCLIAQNDYLRTVLSEEYKKNLEAAKTKTAKKKLQDQYRFGLQREEDLSQDIKKFLEHPNSEDYGPENSLLFEQGILLDEVASIKVAALPKAIRLSKNPKKMMQANYKKALAVAKNKEELETSQKQWKLNAFTVLENNYQVFGSPFGQQGELIMQEIGNNWDKIRAAELAELVKKK